MKRFKLGQILSVTTGILLCDIDGLYGILNYLTGDELYTHALPRASRESAPWLKRRLPFLNEIELPEVNKDNWESVVEQLEKQYGKYHKLQPIPKDEHQVIDPITELKQMAPNTPIITINPDNA